MTELITTKGEGLAKVMTISESHSCSACKKLSRGGLYNKGLKTGWMCPRGYTKSIAHLQNLFNPNNDCDQWKARST